MLCQKLVFPFFIMIQKRPHPKSPFFNRLQTILFLNLCQKYHDYFCFYYFKIIFLSYSYNKHLRQYVTFNAVIYIKELHQSICNYIKFNLLLNKIRINLPLHYLCFTFKDKISLFFITNEKVINKIQIDAFSLN